MGENYSEDNPYRILVDKYEALLKIQQKHNTFASSLGKDAANPGQGVSLHEELQNLSGQFSSFNGNASDSEDDGDDNVVGPSTAQQQQQLAGASCKYSETETTSSSGFSDETSNKCTQTETFFSGSFLCTISDGDDCRFSIYDDASPVESRFRKTPEYRQLFREIFDVLKRAAEAKDEGERLPLLQDEGNYSVCDDDEDDDDCYSLTSSAAALAVETPRVPPATPACEHNPFVSSAESATLAEEQAPQPQLPQQKQPPQQQKQPSLQKQPSSRADEPPKQQQQPTRRHRDIIEELASVKHKKHPRNHNRKSSASRQQTSRDISHLLDFKWTDQVTVRRHPRASGGADRSTWCVPSDAPSPADCRSPADPSSPAHQRREYASAASQEVAKLKLLDKSYAEVLRLRKPQPSAAANCRPQSQHFGRK